MFQTNFTVLMFCILSTSNGMNAGALAKQKESEAFLAMAFGGDSEAFRFEQFQRKTTGPVRRMIERQHQDIQDLRRENAALNEQNAALNEQNAALDATQGAADVTIAQQMETIEANELQICEKSVKIQERVAQIERLQANAASSQLLAKRNMKVTQTILDLLTRVKSIPDVQADGNILRQLLQGMYGPPTEENVREYEQKHNMLVLSATGAETLARSMARVEKDVYFVEAGPMGRAANLNIYSYKPNPARVGSRVVTLKDLVGAKERTKIDELCDIGVMSERYVVVDKNEFTDN